MNTTDKTPVIGTRIPRWTSAYYAGWMQGANNDEYLKPEQIDYSAVTAVIHFAVIPGKKDKETGQISDPAGLDFETNLLNPVNSAALLKAAHAKGAKVLFSVGGAGADCRFRCATSTSKLDKFTTNLVNFMTNNGQGYNGEKYDGLDIDWEPLEASDEGQYASLINLLRQKLSAITPHPLLTAAVKEQPAIFAKLQDQFDQINIMTYDLAGPWDGLTWHNASVYDGGYPNPNSGPYFRSADGAVKAFIKAGVVAQKLGIGIAFYARKWNGVTVPLENAPSNTTIDNPDPSYSYIMGAYYSEGVYNRDQTAQAAYLSIPKSQSGLDNDYFISYDDETSIQQKIDYVSKKGLGGVIIWELTGGWLPSGTTVRDPLLKAVKKATRWMPI